MSKIEQASVAELAALNSADGQSVIQLLKKHNWLDLDVVELKKVIPSPAEPAYAALHDSAIKGGKSVQIIMALLVVAGIGVLWQTMVNPTMDTLTFVAWGVLGAAIGSVAVRNPGRIFKRNR